MPQTRRGDFFRLGETHQAQGVAQRELFKKYNVALIGLQPVRKEVKVPANAPVMGAPDAPITIVEFTDYQCPYCQRAQQYVDRVMDAYKGKVRLVYQEFPLDFHPQAKPAGRAARCAGASPVLPLTNAQPRSSASANAASKPAAPLKSINTLAPSGNVER